MAVALAEGLVQHRHTASSELVMRAVREFDELPTLRLTLEQAMRLLSFDRETCLAVLEVLGEAGLIRRDHHGRYMKVEAG
jgi:hypothetical protein